MRLTILRRYSRALPPPCAPGSSWAVDDEDRVRGCLQDRCKTQAAFEQLLFELSNRHEFLNILRVGVDEARGSKRVTDEAMFSADFVKRLRRSEIVKARHGIAADAEPWQPSCQAIPHALDLERSVHIALQ